MIHLTFKIKNPWSNRWDSGKCWSGNTVIPNKFWELQLMKTSDIVCLEFQLTHRRDHAGLNIELGLFGWNIEFTVYDSRHWNDAQNSWST